MESLIKKLQDMFANRFDGGELQLESYSGERVGGYMAWSGFEGVNQIERQRTVWDYLYSAVSKDDLRKVSSILTLTPGERDAYRENADDDD